MITVGSLLYSIRPVGLIDAHEAGTLHRDVSLGNTILCTPKDLYTEGWNGEGRVGYFID